MTRGILNFLWTQSWQIAALFAIVGVVSVLLRGEARICGIFYGWSFWLSAFFRR